MSILNKAVAVFSESVCRYKISHWKISGKAHIRWRSSSYQSEYLPAFYSFPNECLSGSAELWSAGSGTGNLYSTALSLRGEVSLGQKLSFAESEKLRHRLEILQTVSFFVPRKKGAARSGTPIPQNLSEGNEEVLCRKKGKNG